MSINKVLISQNDKDLFSPSWLAGISGSKVLAKSFKSHDLEAVNVIKTCDKLQLALKQNLNQPKSVEDNDKQCAVIEDHHIPFRDCTNLWYGTLKVFQHQVNTLFHLSQDLVARSSTYDVKSLGAPKRKLSTTSQNIKKRRLTINETTENTFLSSNYSELLDDLARLTQDTTENNNDEATHFSTSSKTRGTHSLAKVHIREITIREISASTYDMPDIEDDDTGFGEATQEEVSQFFNFFEDNSKPEFKKPSVKRKTIYDEEEPPEKCNRFSHDSTIEPVRDENISINNDILRTPRSFRCPSIERSISPTNTIIYQVNETETNNKNQMESSILLPPQNCLENGIPFNNLDSNKEFQLNEIKEEKEEYDKHDTENKILLAENKTSKLIIDECIKIEQNEIIEQMKSSPDLMKVAKKIIFKKLKNRKSITAMELLTRFNRRAIKLTISLKQKISLKPEQFKRDYLNLICDILKSDYKEEWASEIYPKWQNFTTAQKQTNSKRLNKTPNIFKNKAEHCAILNFLDDNLNLAPIDANNNNNPIEMRNVQFPENDWELNYKVTDKWRPYGVMMKLLDMWHYSSKTEIDAVDFCNSAKHKIEKALAFYSLLNLRKNQFIDITKRLQTIEMDKILLGKATISLINNANNSEG